MSEIDRQGRQSFCCEITDRDYYCCEVCDEDYQTPSQAPEDGPHSEGHFLSRVSLGNLFLTSLEDLLVPRDADFRKNLTK